MKTNENGVLVKVIGAMLGTLVLFGAWTGANIIELREGQGRIEVKIERLRENVDRIDARGHSE